MPSKSLLDLAVALALIAALVGLGWVARGWREDSVRLDDERAQSAAYVARLDQFNRQAQSTLVALQDAREAAGNTQREVVREVTRYRDRPCFDAGAVGLLNRAAAGRGPDSAAGALPAGTAGAP